MPQITADDFRNLAKTVEIAYSRMPRNLVDHLAATGDKAAAAWLKTRSAPKPDKQS